jgi:UMF1 family MFS transporter
VSGVTSTAAVAVGARGPNARMGDRREVFGWMMYAWAFHGFVTTVATVMLGPYLTSLAQQAVGENGPVFGPRLLGSVTAKSYFPFCVSLSVFLQVFLLPVVGAVADYSSLKKALLMLTGYVGATCTSLLFLVGTALDFRWGGLLFIVANLSLGATSVLYNAFLPEIVPPDRRDQVSSRGFALGYLGGGLLLGANLLFVRSADKLGITTGQAVRLCFLSAGLWWFAFSIVTFRRLKTRTATRSLLPARGYLATALSGLMATFRELRRLPQTRSFLVAYLFFNDGIQTVISMSAVFLSQELFVARGLQGDQAFVAGLFLMVQFVAFVGALVFEQIARAVGAKKALVISLGIWSAVIVYGYGFLQTQAQAWGMGVVIAMVLGGSQALSRSLFSCMIPSGREAAFFGLYEIANSGTSWIGPFIFGVVVAATNSYRQALLSLIALFAVGSVLLVLTDTRRAIREAGQAS